MAHVTPARGPAAPGVCHSARARRPRPRERGRVARYARGVMRVGIVCPYSLDVAGGVQAHVLDLAQALIELGHDVDVLAPADDATPVPDFVTSAGRAVGIPYNGSVARLTFGPVSLARVRRWVHAGDFDVLHVHEPTAPSLSMLALLVAEGPVVATFHTSTPRSRTMTVLPAAAAPDARAGHRPDRRVAARPAGLRLPPRGGRGRDPQRRRRRLLRRRDPARGLPDRRHRRLPRALHRAAQGHADAARRAAPAGRAPRRPAPARGRARRRRRAGAPGRPRARRPDRPAGRGRRGHQGPDAGLGRRPRRPEHRRRELRGRARRGDGRGRPGGGQRPGGVPAGARRAAGRRRGRVRRRRGVDRGDRGAARRPRPAAALRRAGRERVAAYDWSVVAADVLRVYEVAVAADPRRVVAGPGLPSSS